MATQSPERDELREHLDELAALYGRRLQCLDDWQSTPDDIAGLEAQMQAHLDALVAADEAAIAVVLMLADLSAPWSYYVLVALACRLERFELVRVALLVLDGYGNEEDAREYVAAGLRRAVADALVHHLPDERADQVIAALHGASSHVIPVLAACVGARCWVRAANELRRAAVEPCDDPVAVLRALARLPGAPVGPLLGALGSPDRRVAQAAAIGALRRGEGTTLAFLARNHQAPWTALPLAMGGGPAAAPWLYTGAAAHTVLALGIYGDPGGLDLLLEALTAPAIADSAALGLFLITGARPDAPEPDDSDEGSDEADREPARLLWSSLRGSGITTDPVAWERWLAKRRHHLRPGHRYRQGMLATPQAELEMLSASSLPLWLRRILADEFVIRYGVQWAYEPDLPVVRQREIVARIRARLDDPRLRFIPGAWYFQGRLAS